MNLLSCVRAFIILGLFCHPLFAELKSDKNILKCAWTSNAPVIDGKMDDECWDKADATSGFKVYMLPSQTPSQQTEVRICYDADNIYFYWKLYDSNMDKLFYGPPEDMRDMLNFSNGDLAEIFLDPRKTAKNSYHFCTSPHGTRYDASYKNGRFFNPEWTVKSSIHKDRWELEIAIPFSSFAHEGEYFSTPQDGDKWGVQFCREQSSLHEWSIWNPNNLRGFNNPDAFGELVFTGMKALDLPIVKTEQAKALFFGENLFKYSFSGMQKAKGIFKVQRNSELEEREFQATDGEKTIEFNIEKGGKWQFDFSIFVGDQKVYHAYSWNSLPTISSDLASINSTLAESIKDITDFKGPEKENMEREIKQLRLKSEGLSEQLENAKNFKNGKWVVFVKEVKDLRREWEKIRFNLNLIKLYNKQPEPKKDFVLGVGAPDQKIYRDTEYTGEQASPVKLSMAGGEYESFQLLVIPLWKKLNDVDVKFSAIKGEGKIILPENISWALVDYVHMDQVPFGIDTPREYEPDILMPGQRFNVNPGEIKALWFDVRMPENMPEGDYSGLVTVSCGGQSVNKEVKLHSFGFNLPQKSSLSNNMWFHPYKYDQFYGKSSKKYDIARYEKDAAMLGKYRITPFADHYAIMWNDVNSIGIYLEENGHFSFDFSKWKKFLQAGIKNGGNAYGASLGCNSSLLVPFFNDRKIIDKKTGNEISLFKACPEVKRLNKFFWGEGKHYDFVGENPFFIDFLNAYLKFLEENNALDISYWEFFDEPNSNIRWNKMLKFNKFIRENFHQMKLLNFGVTPLQDRAGRKAIGYIDIWAPALAELENKKLVEILKERRRNYGESYWFYTCSEAMNSQGDSSPYIYYHRPYLGARMHAWFAWKYQSDGMMIFAMTSVPDKNIPSNDTKRWPELDWQSGEHRGCGTLVYPGPDCELIPSMRLANIRDGMEDYEYFVELKKISAYIDFEKYPDLKKEIDRELEIEGSIIEDIYIWTKNIEDIKAKREKLAALIRKIKKNME